MTTEELKEEMAKFISPQQVRDFLESTKSNSKDASNSKEPSSDVIIEEEDESDHDDFKEDEGHASFSGDGSAEEDDSKEESKEEAPSAVRGCVSLVKKKDPIPDLLAKIEVKELNSRNAGLGP